MSAVRTMDRRAVVEMTVASILLLAVLGVWVAGAWAWFTTFLVAAYPCGETYQVEPACALTHPETVQLGYDLVLLVPPLCLLLGTVACVLTVVARRRAVLPAALAFAAALAVFLVGTHLIDTGLADLTPRS